MSLPLTSAPFTCPGLIQYKDGNVNDVPPAGDLDVDVTTVPSDRTSLFGIVEAGQTIGSFYWRMVESEIDVPVAISPALIGDNGIGVPGNVVFDYNITPVPITVEFTVYDSSTLTDRTVTLDFGASNLTQSIAVNGDETVTYYTRKVRSF